MNKEELIKLIESMNLEKEEVVILSSSALVLRGILDTAKDLDIAVTKAGFEKLKNNFELKPGHDDWFKVTDNIDCIIDDMKNKKEKVDDYYLQDINMYLEYLENSDKEKNKLRIPLVKEYIKRKY